MKILQQMYSKCTNAKKKLKQKKQKKQQQKELH